MKPLMIAAAVACLNVASPALADSLAGYDRITVNAVHRSAPVAASVWYPLGKPTYRGLIGDNAVFKGTWASVGAAVAEGRHPLVVLSHGSGGNMDGLGWLSSQLALHGVMVLAVNHPGSTSGDSSPRRSIRLDERAADLRAALDTVLSDPNLGPYVDRARIVSLGFSLGGATALNLAGARLNRASYKSYCERLSGEGDCIFFQKGGVSFDNLPEVFESDMRDSRISAAIAVDPGLTYAFTPESIAEMKLPILLINLGGEERWKALDVTQNGSDLLRRLPNARYAVVKPANHFTFLSECKPQGRELLAEERDDPVCDDAAGTDRHQAHREIVDHMLKFLDR
ncbi:alpha/beta hydrolase family protein [Microvirga rosea]|uniref:alpha/beta hydrolase family protein n=1 Tax=Microvirga rosea TaxID=2715425 RepID=UPI001D09B83D|nr:alpha/beta fold hydrolase [Microvirga rosea]MCB8820753.1 alpha/beta fold hydrolase [Microvirga rosea]